MKKYNKPIYDEKYIQESLIITWWERLLLLFIPSVRVENKESISHFKKLFGKFYLIDFKLNPTPKKGSSLTKPNEVNGLKKEG